MTVGLLGCSVLQWWSYTHWPSPAMACCSWSSQWMPLHICCHSQGHHGFSAQWKHHLLWGLCPSGVSSTDPWWCRGPPTGLHGLWQVCGHLSSSELHGPHEAKGLLAMVATPWVLASLNALCHTLYTMYFFFGMSREISHLICEILPLLKLACADTSIYELMVYMMGVTFLIPPFVAILASYTLILLTVLHMPSNEGRQKALVTCSSHLTVVGMFYGAATFMYVLPSSLHSSKQDNIISVSYTIITPALNPLIYSLRNKEVMGALRRVLQKYMLWTHSWHS